MNVSHEKWHNSMIICPSDLGQGSKFSLIRYLKLFLWHPKDLVSKKNVLGEQNCFEKLCIFFWDTLYLPGDSRKIVSYLPGDSRKIVGYLLGDSRWIMSYFLGDFRQILSLPLTKTDWLWQVGQEWLSNCLEPTTTHSQPFLDRLSWNFLWWVLSVVETS